MELREAVQTLVTFAQGEGETQEAARVVLTHLKAQEGYLKDCLGLGDRLELAMEGEHEPAEAR